LSDSEIIETAKSFQIDSKYALCELDTNFYHFLKSTSKEDSVIVRHHLQPLQVMYFNKEGNMIAFYINCDAGGFPNINWNGNHNFDVFPPAGKHYTPLDTVVTFQKLENFLIPVKNYTPEYNQNADYYVCVFWSKLMGRQSKRLIKLIQQNVQLSQEATKVIFVNTDNFFCKDFKQK
ncbi:MAG: hypothetical protein FWF72_00015, partial [Paludibacter sp.]|nr:hypothetical protein [Paludibacter sp.]